LPLARARQEERVKIGDIVGGSRMQVRLLTMGFRTGDEITVITNSSRGRLVIAAGQKRYVIGREMAKKILVQPRES